MACFLKPDSNGVFTSPLGSLDPSEIEWKTMKDFLVHVFIEKHPLKQITEPQSERAITFEKLFRSAEKLALEFLEKGIETRLVYRLKNGQTFRIF